MQNNGHYTIQVIQSSLDFGTNQKPICNFLLVINTILTNILSCTNSKLMQIIGQYMCFPHEVPLLTHLFGVNP